jgi:hypothetical protein
LDFRLFIFSFQLSAFSFRLSVFCFLFSAFSSTPWGGTNIGTGRKFPKKVAGPAYPAFACAVKARWARSFKVQVGGQEEEGKKQRGIGGAEHGAGRSMDGLEQDAPAT